MADFNMRMMEVTEIIERNHLDVMAKINQITDTALKINRIIDVKLQQGNTPFSNATMINSTKHEPSCTIAFAGTPEPDYGNTGVGGAGVVLFAEDGSLYCGFRKGERFKYQTKENVEYRALILGMKQAIMKGFKHITVEGDSKFVINQFGKPWQTIDFQDLCLEAIKLRKSFHSFSINLISEENNSPAILQAKRATYLEDGQVEEDNLLIENYWQQFFEAFDLIITNHHDDPID